MKPGPQYAAEGTVDHTLAGLAVGEWHQFAPAGSDRKRRNSATSRTNSHKSRHGGGFHVHVDHDGSVWIQRTAAAGQPATKGKQPRGVLA